MSKDYSATATNLAALLSIMTRIKWMPKMADEQRDWGTAFVLIAANGMLINVINDYQSKGTKFSINGDYPKWKSETPYFPDEKPRICIAQSKSCEQIAIDIQRRFLGDYVTLWNKMNDRIKAWEKQDNEEIEMLVEMASILNPGLDRKECFREYKEEKSTHRRVCAYDENGENKEIEITHHVNNLVKIELSRLTIDEAKKVVALYKSLISVHKGKPISNSTS